MTSSARGAWELRRPENLPASWWEGWDALNDTQMQGHPALRAAAVRLLVSCFGSAQLRFAAYALREGPVLAMAIIEPAGFGRWSIFRASQAPVPPLVFAKDMRADTAAPQALLRAAGAMAVALEFPRQDPKFALLEPSAGLVTHSALWGTTVSIESKAGFETYWNERPRDLRLNIGRYLRRAEREGCLPRFARIQSAKDMPPAVDRYAALESAGWKGREGTALSADNAQGRFYRKLLCEYAEGGAGSIFELYFNEKLVASRIAVSGRNMHVMLKTTYDEEVRRHAPGRLLLHFAIREMLSAQDPRPIEFHTRADHDLTLWSTHQREVRDWTVYRSRLVAAVANARRSSGRRPRKPAAER